MLNMFLRENAAGKKYLFFQWFVWTIWIILYNNKNSYSFTSDYYKVLMLDTSFHKG